MSLHQELLPVLVEDIRSYHEACAIVLIGSVARGQERPESDIDLNIFLPEGDAISHASPYVDHDNRWQLRVKSKMRGVRIDVAWETYQGLKERLRRDGPINCWPFSNGVVLYDCSEAVAPCLHLARTWFEERPEVAERIEREYLKAKQRQIRERATEGGQADLSR